jgi:hypothetical protein
LNSLGGSVASSKAGLSTILIFRSSDGMRGQRIGDDPATLLRNYTKRKRSKKADENLSDAIAGLATGFLGS